MYLPRGGVCRWAFWGRGRWGHQRGGTVMRFGPYTKDSGGPLPLPARMLTPNPVRPSVGGPPPPPRPGVGGPRDGTSGNTEQAHSCVFRTHLLVPEGHMSPVRAAHPVRGGPTGPRVETLTALVTRADTQPPGAAQPWPLQPCPGRTHSPRALGLRPARPELGAACCEAESRARAWAHARAHGLQGSRKY